MSVCDAPQWLQAEWLRSCRDVGIDADRELVEETGRRLLNRWCRAERHFHNVRHLSDVLQRIDEMARELQRPAIVRLAAFYHGVVFDERRDDDGRAGEDELSSASLAESELLGLGASPQVAARVAALVLSLHDHMPHPGDGDCAGLRDAELATLAVEPQRYQSYLREVRSEYPDIPRGDFLQARKCLLTALLKRDRIFVTPHGATWEDAARQNITAELRRVDKELTALNAEPSTAAAGSGASTDA